MRMSRTDFARGAVLALAAAAIAAPSNVDAQAGRNRIVSGTGPNGMAWQAQSRIVGVGPTGTAGGGAGDAINLATNASYSGTVAIIMDYGPGIGSFICSGSLLPDRVSILTAAHCVSDGFGTAGPLTTTVYFPDVTNPTASTIATNLGSRAVTNIAVNPLYTGDVIDQNDIAVLRMASPAPASAVSYGLFTPSGLTGQDFNVAGYGGRSSVGGSTGTGGGNGLATGRLRQGNNRFDFRMGDSDFGTTWSTVLGEPAAQIAFSYVSDFDNGLAVNDASCRVVQASNFPPGLAPGGVSAKYCNTGRGASEVGVAGGDSGGPQFINGQIASVTSYGLTFGTGFGDILGGLNSSFGEFSGYVPVYIHANWINAQLATNVIPEPSTYALMATGLIALGAAARRRRNAA
jgi:hypothetical protein